MRICKGGIINVICNSWINRWLIAGFFASRYFFKKQLQKNPPINEKMIRAMYMEMGRKPSEAQIKRIMASVKSQYK